MLIRLLAVLGWTVVHPSLGTAASPETLEVRNGFRMELVAGSALVESPAGLDFDAQGRLYVAENRAGSGSGDGDSGGAGVVRLLEDNDNDGIYDTSVVMAEGLDQPTGIVCSRGGVFVACETGLWFISDQDGDGKADLRRRLLSWPSLSDPGGFRLQHTSLTFGPDGRVYAAYAGERVSPVRAGGADVVDGLPLSGGGFSFSALNLDLRPEAGSDIAAQTFDQVGRRFVARQSGAVEVEIIPGRAAGRNPYLAAVPTHVELLAAGGRPGPKCCLVYRGTNYGVAAQGSMVVSDFDAGTVSVVRLEEGEVHPRLTTRGGEARVPLVRGLDDSFKPIHLGLGPGDFLYIADSGLTAQGAAFTNALDRPGRIWRLRPEADTVEPKRFFSSMEPETLVTGLKHSNVWVRSTAARLLIEQRGSGAALELRRLLQFGKAPSARLGALAVLEASDLTVHGDMARVIHDPNAFLRTAAATLFVRSMSGAQYEFPVLQRLMGDASAEVRLAAALGMGGLEGRQSAGLLAAFYSRDSRSVWGGQVMRTIRPELMGPLLVELAGVPGLADSPHGSALLAELATGIGLGGEGASVSECLEALADLPLSIDQVLPIVVALGRGVEGRGRRLPEVDVEGQWRTIVQNAQTIAVDGVDAPVRADAVRVLGMCLGSELVADEFLLLMFAPGLPVEMQAPVIRALAAQGLERDFEALTQRWHLWGAAEQAVTLDTLLEWDDGARILLRALEDGTIPVDVLTSTHLSLLRNHVADDIRRRAIQRFGETSPDRDALLGDFISAAELEGVAGHGAEVFRLRCATCHDGGRASIGPPLESLASGSPLQLIAGIVHPSRTLVDSHRTTVLRLADGRLVWGASGDISGPVITLATAEGPRRYARSGVQRLQQPVWSLMSENAAAGLTTQDVADLVAYIRTSTR